MAPLKNLEVGWLVVMSSVDCNIHMLCEQALSGPRCK